MLKEKKILKIKINEMVSNHSIEYLKKLEEEVNVLAFTKNKRLNNHERNVLIQKLMNALGEDKEYFQLEFSIIRNIAFYVFEYGLQNGDLLNNDIEKLRLILFKSLLKLDISSLRFLLYAFQGTSFYYKELIKKNDQDFLQKIDVYDEIDYNDSTSVDSLGRIENAEDVLNKLYEKFDNFTNIYLSNKKKVKQNPNLYTKLLIPIYPFIMEYCNLRTDRELIIQIRKDTGNKRGYQTIERALNRYRIKNRNNP